MEDVLLDDRPVQIVRAVAQRHLRQLHAQAHPVGGDVIEVVEVDAAHGDGAQRVETRGRRLHRDVVVLRLIRQSRPVGIAVLLGIQREASANYFPAVETSERGSTNDKDSKTLKSEVLKVIKCSAACACNTATSRAS